jgi:hypothetical protein
MPEPCPNTRRRFIQASIACVGLTALARPALASANPAIVTAARAGLERLGARIAHRDVVGVADFSQPSRLPRLHLVDLVGGGVESVLVAHGRGSDPAHTGWLSRFSNAPGSAATSEGAYLTGDDYIGEHGRSMRLVGLDPSNSNAEPRAIVVHDAWYVGPQMLAAHGMLGRSEGCFAVASSDLPTMLGRLGPGRLLIAGKL